MKNLLGAPKIQLIITLLPILLTAVLLNFSLPLLINPAIIILSAIGFDFLFLKIRKKNLFMPSAAVATGLIISLIIDPSAPLYVCVAASFAAMFSKNFIRPIRHIFNPAAFGMIFIALVFSSFTSWWGPSALLGTPLFFLILLPALVSAYRMKRYLTISTFFLSYCLIAVLFFGADPQRVLLDPTVIFFSLVMAPEPMTTPAKKQNQILFGLFLSLLVFVFSRFLIGLPLMQRIDPLIFSLLIGNLIFFKRR